MAQAIPNPKQFRSTQQWAEQLYEFMTSQSRNVEQNNPLPVLLAHQVGNSMPRAATDGVLMWNPIDKVAVISYSGAWVSVGYAPNFAAAQIADVSHTVNTSGKVAGKVIYDETNDTLAVANGSGPTDTWSRLTVAATVTPS